MLDIRYIRENLGEAINLLNRRGEDFSYLEEVVKKDNYRKQAITEAQKLKTEKNRLSKEIGKLKQAGEDASDIIAKVKAHGEEIRELDEKIKTIESEISDALLRTPNLPHPMTPIGEDEEDNLEISVSGEPTTFDFEPKTHDELGEDLGILDFERAGKIAGSRFVVYKGLGARLERSLIQFMMDVHADKHGYEEIIPPYIVNGTSMTATGQFPKFKEDAFRIEDDRDFYLNPTAEVPAINLHRDEVIDKADLPLKYVAFTTAFRQEAGSAGKDTRGIMRQHQFNKVELIKFSEPEKSYDALESMLEDSEKILKMLEIPYRVVELCTGDLGFSMRKTYDLEVWLPGQNRYREIGSISNAEDYQARRGNIKYRPEKDANLTYVHTLNGSGLAIGRTVIAIMENYQQEDGSIKIPGVLVPYMHTEAIKKG